MKEDLTGRQFGRLFVVGDGGKNEKGRHYWKCKCACGKETLVEESHLKAGHTKSCGCYRRERPKARCVDLTGQRFGRLTVLGPVVEKNGRISKWECLCDCGNRVTCYRENLQSRTTQSCGCLREEVRRDNMRKAIHFVAGTCIEGIAKQKTCSNNTTGHRGVYRRKNNKWRASIGFQGKVYNLGTFSSYEEAVQARLEAESRMYVPFLERYYSGKNGAAQGNAFCTSSAQREGDDG